MTINDAENLNKEWNGSSCKHSKLERLDENELDIEGLVCLRCGTLLNDIEHPEYFYHPNVVAKLRKACFDLIEDSEYQKRYKIIENVEAEIADISECAEALFSEAFGVYRVMNKENLDVVIRAINFISKCTWAHVKYTPAAFRVALEVLLPIAQVDNNKQDYKDTAWEFLYDLSKGIENYKKNKDR